MQARGALMIEHRLSERMLAVIRRALEQVGQTQRIDPYFADAVVVFFPYIRRSYSPRKRRSNPFQKSR